MSCASCVARIEDHVGSQEGVLSVSVNFLMSQCFVEFLSPPLTSADVMEFINEVSENSYCFISKCND